MKIQKILYLIISITLFSCSPTKKRKIKAESLNILNRIPELTETDTVKFPYGFVNLVSCNMVETKDSILYQITFSNLPDSISFNNPNLVGYTEYSLEIIWIDPTKPLGNKMMLNCEYNRSLQKEVDKEPMRRSFTDFLNNYCHTVITVEHPIDIHTSGGRYLDEKPIFSVKNNVMTIKSNKAYYSADLNSFLWGGWSVHITYNYPDSGCNITLYEDYLTNDQKVYNFLGRGKTRGTCN